MGWKSTVTVSRGRAIAEILYRVYQASNGQLADALEDLVDEEPGESYDDLYGHNFTVEGTEP